MICYFIIFIYKYQICPGTHINPKFVRQADIKKAKIKGLPSIKLVITVALPIWYIWSKDALSGFYCLHIVLVRIHFIVQSDHSFVSFLGLERPNWTCSKTERKTCSENEEMKFLFSAAHDLLSGNVSRNVIAKKTKLSCISKVFENRKQFIRPWPLPRLESLNVQIRVPCNILADIVISHMGKYIISYNANLMKCTRSRKTLFGPKQYEPYSEWEFLWKWDSWIHLSDLWKSS